MIAALLAASVALAPASNAADRRAGQALRRHLRMIAFTTHLRRDRRGRQIANALCTLVGDSGTAADPSGHAVYGRNDARLRPC